MTISRAAASRPHPDIIGNKIVREKSATTFKPIAAVTSHG